MDAIEVVDAATTTGTRQTTLDQGGLDDLRKRVTTLPEGTQIEFLGFRRLGEENFREGSLETALFTEDSLRKIQDRLVEHAKTSGDLSVCGYKLPVVWSHLRITKKPGQEPVEIYAVAQAIMVIPDSPLHHHVHTFERYQILDPEKWGDLATSLRENGIKDRLTKDGFMVSGPNMNELELEYVQSGQSIPIPTGLIHGFGTTNENDALLVILNFYPGLVPKDVSAFPDNLKPAPGINPIEYRDEELEAIKARAMREQLLSKT